MPSQTAGLSRAGSMISIARSAKDSIGRVAGESGFSSGSNIFERLRAKMGTTARSYQKLADDAVERATSRSRRRKSTGSSVPDKTKGISVDESAVQMISAMGVPPVTARYALVRCRGNYDAACDWLFDEENREEIEAAEAAEMENAMKWIHENFPQPTLDKFPRADDFERKLRRESVLSDDGGDDPCGSGDVSSRDSFPSPRKVPSPTKVPLPGRLSRGSLDSGRLSIDSTDGRRESFVSKGSVKREKAGFVPLVSDSEGSGCETSNHVESDSEDETAEELENPVAAAPPPESACWEWPLSRHEKKARVHMLERQMHAMDRKSLLQELGELRGQGGHLRKGRASHRPRLST